MYFHQKAITNSFDFGHTAVDDSRAPIDPLSYRPHDSYPRREWFSDWLPEAHEHRTMAHDTGHSGLRTTPSFSGGHGERRAEHMPERFRYKDYNLGPGVPEHASISNEKLMLARGRDDYDTGLQSALERLEAHGAPPAAVKKAKGVVVSAALEKGKDKAAQRSRGKGAAEAAAAAAAAKVVVEPIVQSAAAAPSAPAAATVETPLPDDSDSGDDSGASSGASTPRRQSAKELLKTLKGMKANETVPAEIKAKVREALQEMGATLPSATKKAKAMREFVAMTLTNLKAFKAGGGGKAPRASGPKKGSL